jgi:hypothetical protein
MLSLTLCVAHDVATATQQSSSVARDQGNRCHMAGRDVLWGIHCIIDTTRVVHVLLIFGGMASSAPVQRVFASLIGSKSIHYPTEPKEW